MTDSNEQPLGAARRRVTGLATGFREAFVAAALFAGFSVRTALEGPVR